MAGGGQKRIIQLTGFKKQEKKALLEWLFKLDCFFLDNKKYRNCTHLIAKKPCKSEKFLAACAAGKWILTKEYIINSAESGRWLDETTYEWGYEIEKDTHYSPQMQSAPKRWREELTHSSAPGAFHRWKVVLLVKEGDKQMASIRRVLQAGKATICSSQNAEHNITHIFINNKIFAMQNKKCLSEARCYPLQYLGDYLFETDGALEQVAQRDCGVSILEDIQEPPVHAPGQLALGGPPWAKGLDQMSSRYPFQLHPFCDSVIEKLSFKSSVLFQTRRNNTKEAYIIRSSCSSLAPALCYYYWKN